MLYRVFDDTEVLIALTTSRKESQKIMDSKDFYCFDECVRIEGYNNALGFQKIVEDILEGRAEGQSLLIVDGGEDVSMEENELLDLAKIVNKMRYYEKE